MATSKNLTVIYPISPPQGILSFKYILVKVQIRNKSTWSSNKETTTARDIHLWV